MRSFAIAGIPNVLVNERTISETDIWWRGYVESCRTTAKKLAGRGNEERPVADAVAWYQLMFSNEKLLDQQRSYRHWC